MGSIVGVVSRRRPDVARVGAMLESAPHRGSVHETVESGRTALGISHRTDLRTAWLAQSGPWVAAVGGAVDNTAEVARELRRSRVEFDSEEPAAVVLAAFRVWGEQAVAQLRGAYAGLVSNGDKFWAFRDQVGFRPLFYGADDQASYWGSEAKQVVAGIGVRRRADLEGVETLYYDGPGENSAVAGVKRLLAASLATDRAGHISTRRYWDPTHLVETARLGLPEALEGLLEQLERSVRRVVRGPDGVFLSGGIDSTTVAAFAAAHELRNGRPLRGITFTYPKYPSVDERSYVEEVADYLGIQVHYYEPAVGHLDNLEFWVDLVDGPWDTLPIGQVAESYTHARHHQVSNLLSGDIGEIVYTMSRFFLGHLALRGRIGSLLRHTEALRAEGYGRGGIAKRILKEVAPPRILTWHERRKDRMRLHRPNWLDAGATGRPVERRTFSVPARRRWIYQQTYPLYATASTWEANEICAAYFGVEDRRPLVDVDLWEFFLSLPAEVKFPDPISKGLIRRAMRGRLPDRILDRRDKTIFNEYVLGTADYDGVRNWIHRSDYRMPGVDYDMLSELLDGRRLTARDLIWAYDLAKVHAFMEAFS